MGDYYYLQYEDVGVRAVPYSSHYSAYMQHCIPSLSSYPPRPVPLTITLTSHYLSYPALLLLHYYYYTTAVEDTKRQRLRHSRHRLRHP